MDAEMSLDDCVLHIGLDQSRCSAGSVQTGLRLPMVRATQDSCTCTWLGYCRQAAPSGAGSRTGVSAPAPFLLGHRQHDYEILSLGKNLHGVLMSEALRPRKFFFAQRRTLCASLLSSARLVPPSRAKRDSRLGSSTSAAPPARAPCGSYQDHGRQSISLPPLAPLFSQRCCSTSILRLYSWLKPAVMDRWTSQGG